MRWWGSRFSKKQRLWCAALFSGQQCCREEQMAHPREFAEGRRTPRSWRSTRWPSRFCLESHAWNYHSLAFVSLSVLVILCTARAYAPSHDQARIPVGLSSSLRYTWRAAKRLRSRGLSTDAAIHISASRGSRHRRRILSTVPISHASFTIESRQTRLDGRTCR